MTEEQASIAEDLLTSWEFRGTIDINPGTETARIIAEKWPDLITAWAMRKAASRQMDRVMKELNEEFQEHHNPS